MKKMIATILTILMLASIPTGCVVVPKGAAEYASNVIELKADSTLVKKQYERIYTLVESKEESFSDEELTSLYDIHFAFTETANRVSEMMDDPTRIITPDELKSMYELAYIGYTNAREIITEHREEFTSYQWSQMVEFDKKAKEYDTQVRLVFDNPDTDDINKTLGVMITLGTTAYKYLLPVLVAVI